MKRTFLVEHKDSYSKPPIKVTLYDSPYEPENILNKTGWRIDEVKITEITEKFQGEE